MSPQENAGNANRRVRRPIKDWAVNDLLLDSQNPRLPPSRGTPSQEALLLLIVKAYTITELMDSFAINGYFDEEPLVGVPVPDDPSILTIV